MLMYQPDHSEFDSFNTRELWEKDKTHIIHPQSVWPSFKQKGCTVLARGEGAYVFDADGNRYLDSNGGLWSVNIGYGRAELAEAMAEQARLLPQVNHFGDCTSPPAVELATKLAGMTPGDLDHVFYTNGGTDANDSAIRIIHHYFILQGKPEKKHIIARTDSYHGTSYMMASVSGKANTRQNRFHYVDDITHLISSPSNYRRPAGTSLEEFRDMQVKELEDKILEIGPERVACFICEPIMGVGGVHEAAPGFHRRAWEVCRKYGVLYVHDEVITAFGRLGHWFASEDVFDVVPDVICCAKGITSGYQPLGAALISAEIFGTISSAGMESSFAHGYTYTAHPVCCAAALKNLEIMEREQLLEHVRTTGPYFEEKMSRLGDLPLVGDARGRSYMFALEFVSDRKTKQLFPPETEIARRITDAARRRGLLARGIGEMVLISPPLILTREQIDFITGVLRESIEEVAVDLAREGLWQG